MVSKAFAVKISTVPLLLYFFTTAATGNPLPPSFMLGEIVRVHRVVDGDTVEAWPGIKIRYIGVDTPETRHPRRPVECYGKEAAAANRRMVEGKKVLLVPDTITMDPYGRILRYVYLLDGNGGPAVFVNEELIARGLGRARLYPPNTREKRRLMAAERKARRNRRGIWSLPPKRPRGKRRNMVLADRRKRTYHRPGTQAYEDLRCAPRPWVFPSAEAAERAGLRPGAP